MRDISPTRRGDARARCSARSSRNIPEAKGKLVHVGRRLDVSDSWNEFQKIQYRRYVTYRKLNLAFSIFVIALVPIVFLALMLRLLVS